MFKNLTNVQKWTVFTFLFVPLLSSLISTIHIVDFFEIGNFVWMAYVLAVAFEIGSIASAIALTVLDKISKFAVWSIFIILVFFQLLGNIFFSFDFITRMEMTNPEYLKIVSDFLNYFYEFENTKEFKVTLSILIGMPIPLISLAFLKSVIDYIGNILKDNDGIEESPEVNINIDEDLEIEAEALSNIQTPGKKDISKKEQKELIEEIIAADEADGLYEEPEEIIIEETSELIEEELIEKDEGTTFVFNSGKFVEEENKNEIEDSEDSIEKKTEYINNKEMSAEDLKELVSKKEEIEEEYEHMQKMKKQLEEFYPQVYGKKYEGQ